MKKRIVIGVLAIAILLAPSTNAAGYVPWTFSGLRSVVDMLWYKLDTILVGLYETNVRVTGLEVTPTSNIADGSVTTAKLADDAVTTAKIAAGAVGTTDIADDAVTAAKIAAGAVGTSDIADSAVTTTKIADAAIGAAKLASDVITTDKIAAGSVATSDIADSAVTTAKIADGTIAGGDLAAGIVISTTGEVGVTATDDGVGSFQGAWADVTLPASATTGSYHGGMMGNVFGTNLTDTDSAIFGVLGKYTVDGTNASTEPKGGVIGEVAGDPVTTTADGAVIAVLGGDAGITTANAAFKVMGQNSTAGSGFTYGLDLFNANTGAYLDNDQLITTDIRLQNGESINNNSDGRVAVTGAMVFVPGSKSMGANSDLTAAEIVGSVMRVTATVASATITNIDAGAEGQVLVIENAGATNSVVLDATVTNVVNPLVHGSADITLDEQYENVTLVYMSSKWVVTGKAQD